MRILGLDIGDKRIGVAISDKLEIISTPLVVFDNDENIEDKLKSLIDEYNVEKIVVGMPYTLKGEIGNQAKKVIEFVENKLRDLDIEIDYIDERFTTKIPLKSIEKKVKSNKIDRLSASIILKDYLNKRKKS